MACSQHLCNLQRYGGRMKSVTKEEAEDTKIRLLARVQELAATVSALLNPE